MRVSVEESYPLLLYRLLDQENNGEGLRGRERREGEKREEGRERRGRKGGREIRGREGEKREGSREVSKENHIMIVTVLHIILTVY